MQSDARPVGPTRLVTTLAAAGLISGLVLVAVYLLTAPRIERNRQEALRRAVFRVLPDAASFTGLAPSEGRLVPAESAEDGELVYEGRDADGRVVGHAVPAEGPGFMDTVSLLYGIDTRRGVIVGMQVLQSRETPGLGDKIAHDPAFLANFAALSYAPTIEPVKRGEKTAPNQVDCITGATISSEAVVDILNRSTTRWLPVLDGETERAGEGAP